MLLPPSPEAISVLLIIATNFPSTFLVLLLSLVALCCEVHVGVEVDVLGLSVEPVPARQVCLCVASRVLGLVVFPLVGGLVCFT